MKCLYAVFSGAGVLCTGAECINCRAVGHWVLCTESVGGQVPLSLLDPPVTATQSAVMNNSVITC